MNIKRLALIGVVVGLFGLLIFPPTRHARAGEASSPPADVAVKKTASGSSPDAGAAAPPSKYESRGCANATAGSY